MKLANDFSYASAIPLFNLIFWYGSFVGTEFMESFARNSQNSAEIVRLHKISNGGVRCDFDFLHSDNLL